MIGESAQLICIDNDPATRAQIKAALDDIAPDVKTSWFAASAAALSAHHAKPADLVLCSARLGATYGLDVIESMRAAAPQSVYMLLSDDSHSAHKPSVGGDCAIFRRVKKPLDLHALKIDIMAAITENQMRKLRLIAASSLGALAHLQAGVAMIDLRGGVIFANEAARLIFSESGFFEIRPDGRLRPALSAEARRFEAFLGQLARSGASHRSVFRFSHPDRADPIVVSALYCREGGDRPAHVSLIITDPLRRKIANAEDIGAALDLTPSEARVVHGLVTEGSIAAAAARAGVSVSSARTYLKNVFGKTGVSRQAELVRLVFLTAA